MTEPMEETTIDTAAPPDLVKALAIAKDVLERFDKRRYMTGNYVWGYLGKDKVPEDANDLQAIIPLAEEYCEVCLLGSCLLSKAKLFDEVPLSELQKGSTSLGFNRNVINDQLRPIFGYQQMDLLESWFEKNPMPYTTFTEEHLALCRGAAIAGRAYTDLELRVKAAMENFISNGGKLVVDSVSEDDYDEDFDDDEDDE